MQPEVETLMTWTGSPWIDRTQWDQGPWDSEPDKAQWVDGATGLDCIAVRNRAGAWCGYVGIPEGHSYFGLEYTCGCPVDCDQSRIMHTCEHTPESVFYAHGGLTFSGFSDEGSQPFGICHMARPGRPSRIWWIGFDTGHFGDLSPMRDFPRFGQPQTYRTLEYVMTECASLAQQVEEVARAA